MVVVVVVNSLMTSEARTRSAHSEYAQGLGPPETSKSASERRAQPVASLSSAGAWDHVEIARSEVRCEREPFIEVHSEAASIETQEPLNPTWRFMGS